MPHSSSDLEEIHRSFEAARAAWPAVEVSFEAFSARLPGRECDHATDIYLACALSAADPSALAAFDRRFLGEVAGVVARIDASDEFVAEVQQILRERLFVGPNAKIRDYRGRGPLGGWIRTAAIRTALNLRRSIRREAAQVPALAVAEPFEQLIDSELGPEIALLRRRHAPQIDAALRRATAALDAGERRLLQLYYVDRLTLAQIAALDRIGTSTAFRRLNAATQAVLARVKDELAANLQLSADGLDSLIRHVQDDIDLSLSQLLGTP